jgi:hypothetical protein
MIDAMVMYALEDKLEHLCSLCDSCEDCTEINACMEMRYLIKGLRNGKHLLLSELSPTKTEACELGYNT